MNNRAPPTRYLTRRQIFAAPVAIALLSLAGLFSALTGDGWRDLFAWACLALPIALVAWAIRARRT